MPEVLARGPPNSKVLAALVDGDPYKTVLETLQAASPVKSVK